MAASPNSPLKPALLSLLSLLLLSFFLLLPSPHRHARLLLQSEPPPCSPSTPAASSSSLLDFSYLHSCVFRRNSLYSVPLLSMILVLHFYFLIKTAHSHFSIVVTVLAARLRLSPSMGAVTLLALGNGAPDVFSSISAVRSGRPRTGFGAILSAGAFVSAFVVGVVAIHAAPFALDPAAFARDVFFYFVAASGLFYVYLSAEIYLWQAAGFVAFYLFFVAFVVWMDAGSEVGGRKKAAAAEVEMGGKVLDYDDAIGFPSDKGDDKRGWSICGFLKKVWTLDRYRLFLCLVTSVV